MTWLNPLALAGLITLGVPILIHLFGRRVARRLKFPSLRLLGEAAPTPATRSVPGDLLLLAVRCAILAVAVLALAQPAFTTASRARDARRPVRLILVDTSASMRRLTSSGAAIDAARAIARAQLDSARDGVLIESANPGASLSGAASWLETHSGLREVVVVSDFQAGSLHEGQVQAIPAGVGLRLVRVDAADRPAALTAAGLDSVVVDSAGTYAAWSFERTDSVAIPTLLGSADERAQAEHAVTAVGTLLQRPVRTSDRVAVVFAGHPTHGALASQAKTLDAPWQGDLLVRLWRDRALGDVMRGGVVAEGCLLPGTVFAHNDAGTPTASLARAGAGLAHDVLVFACVAPGSLAATGLLASVAAALDSTPPATESEPLTLPDELLERWEREPTVSAPRGVDETSPDGRWLWLLALGLLGIEEWLRRRSPKRMQVTEPEVPRARVA